MTPRSEPRQRGRDAYGNRVVTVKVEITTRKMDDGGWAASISFNGNQDLVLYGGRTRKAALEELAAEIGDSVVSHA